ncbi:MAG: SDR family oxidoreductase [bacterium]|nr:SDR family oxidoreductase [bacterium]
MASRNKKRILITGAEGYLGSVIAPFLIERGYEVVGLDTGYFKDALLYDLPPYPVVAKDARDFSAEDLEEIDVVVHLAGMSINDAFGDLSGEKLYEPSRLYSRAIADLCKKRGVKFIFASSCSIYGKSGDTVLDERAAVNPQIEYARNKLSIEEDLKAMADTSFSPIALRFATAFGPSPRMRFDIVVNMLTGMAVAENKIVLNSDGEAWRPNVHVLDIAKAVECAVESSYSGGALLVLNVGRDDNNMKIIEIARIISEECGGTPISFEISGKRGAKSELVTSSAIRADGSDSRNYRVSFGRIKEQFPDFVCRYSVREGIKEMIKKFKEIKLTNEQFQNRSFYRIKILEDLYTRQQIDSDLFWKQHHAV